MPWKQPFGIGVKIPTDNKVIVTTSISILDNDNREIGFITEFTYDTTRRVERIRVLYAGAAGRVVEQVPGPEDLTLRCTGFSLYDQTLPGALTQGTDTNKIFHALASQFNPFKISVEQIHPVTDDTITIEFGGCWISDFSHPIRQADLYVAETATIQPSWIHTIEPSTQEEVAE